MEINLQKDQKVELTKTTPRLNKLIVGGGWDVSKNASSFDLDMSAFLLKEGKLKNAADIVYFGAKKHASGGVELDKDNLTGEGEGDDEKVFVDLSKIPTDVNEVHFAINIYKAVEKKQNFGQVSNAFIRVMDAGANNAVLIKYDLSEDYSVNTGVIAGKIYRHDGGWKFQALGKGVNGSIQDIANTFA